MAFLYVVIVIQFAIIFYITFIHAKERKDLYNRIMSRDLGDYQKLSSGNPPPKGGNFLKNSFKRSINGREEA